MVVDFLFLSVSVRRKWGRKALDMEGLWEQYMYEHVSLLEGHFELQLW